MLKRSLIFLFLCASLALTGAAPSPAQDVSQGENQDAISVRLRGIDGKTYDLAEMRGQVVLVSFGATWCKPCAWELAALEELKKEYAGRPVRFLWVSIETEPDVSDKVLRQYAERLRLTIPVLRDPNRATYAQFSDTVRLPVVVFFDANGRFIAPKHTGMSPQPDEYKNMVRRRVDALLAAVRTRTAAGTN